MSIQITLEGEDAKRYMENRDRPALTERSVRGAMDSLAHAFGEAHPTNKISLIKAIRGFTGCTLREAANYVNECYPVKENCNGFRTSNNEAFEPNQ